MSIWTLILAVAVAGSVGGILNALLSDNGFILPRREQVDQGQIVRPGVIANILIGAVAAIVTWGLYGPLTAAPVIGATLSPEEYSITLGALVGAIVVGVGGARWLTNEVDKTLLKAAAVKSLAAPSAPGESREMVTASPARVLEIAQRNAGRS